MGVIVVPKFELQDVKDTDIEQSKARAYWADAEFKYYTKPRPWSDFIATKVLAYKPQNVFEFGCNAGKNLHAIRNIDDTVFLSGTDINRAAIEHGRQEGLRLSSGDENLLSVIPTRAFDVSFTVSVLDHIATPGPVLQELARISSKAVILLEPWLGAEGKVTRNFNQASGAMIDTTPFSYSWDYRKLASEVLPNWAIETEHHPLASNLGPYYELFELTPQRA